MAQGVPNRYFSVSLVLAADYGDRVASNGREIEGKRKRHTRRAGLTSYSLRSKSIDRLGALLCAPSTACITSV